MTNITETSFLVKLLDPTAKLPTRGSAESVGYDLYAFLPDHTEVGISILPTRRVVIRTGVSARPPKGYFLRCAPRSGLASKSGIDVLAGVIDPDYTGEIMCILQNNGDKAFKVNHGDKICQMILLAYTTPDIVVVDALDNTDRGENGFGSTGS